MGLDINTNMLANTVADHLSANQAKLQNSLEKLSTGYAINKAADDSSGLVISQHLQSAISGFQQGMTNTQNGINVIQTADGALNEVSNILQRIKTLAVEVGNGTAMDTDAKSAANAEAQQSLQAIDQIAQSTSFGKNNLLSNGSATVMNFTFLVGDNTSADTVSFTIGALNALSMALGSAYATQSTSASAASTTGTSVAGAVTDGHTLTFKVDGGSTQTITFSGATTGSAAATAISGGTGVAASFAGGKFTVATTATGAAHSIQITGGTALTELGLSAGSAISGADAGSASTYASFDLSSANALTNINTAISNVAATRGTLGAYQNEMQHVANNESTMVQNLQASNAAVQDTNMAKEMVSFTQKQVLVQAGVSLLSQANSSSQSVLKLIGG